MNTFPLNQNILTNQTFEVFSYYRFDEKTGLRMQYRIQKSFDNFYMFNEKFFKKDGQPRKSILVKGKRYYKYE